MSAEPLQPSAVRWPSGAATGIGSMPGTDPREASRIVLGELPDLPHLVELPARGPGADMIGRTVALLPDFFAETVPTGWQLTGRPGADERRALSWLGEDLDTVEEFAAGHDGLFKISLTGPFTLAAGLELVSGERAVRDHGAVRDLTAALVEAIAAHVADVRRRLPSATVVLQLDEPSLPAVLGARVPTASGLATLRRVDTPIAEGLLRQVVGAVVDAGAVPVVHSCAPDVPVALLHRAGVRGVSFDLSVVPASDEFDQEVGECVDDGVRILLGVVPTDGSGPSDPVGTVRPVRKWWHRLGFDPGLLADAVVLTPACGLAGRPWPAARGVLAQVREAARVLEQDPEGER